MVHPKYNLKDPEDDQDATTKIYVDTKQYNINNANITGNLPWSRVSNLPTLCCHYVLRKLEKIWQDNCENTLSHIPKT